MGLGKGKTARLTVAEGSAGKVKQRKPSSSSSSSSKAQQVNPVAATSSQPVSQPEGLQALPSELLSRIIDHTFCGHNPNEVVTGRQRTCEAMRCLAATSDHFRNHVELSSKLLLAEIGETTTQINIQKKEKTLKRNKNMLGFTNALYRFKDKFCVFCGRKCSRQSVMMTTMRCCKPCENDQWGIITRSAAKKKFDLKDEHFNQDAMLPSVRTGLETGRGFNNPAVMHLYDDVAKLANAVHGRNWEDHMADKEVQKQAHQQAREDARRLKEAKAARKLALQQRQQQILSGHLPTIYPMPQ